MIDMEMENERVVRLRSQRLGEEWIQAITEGAFDRLGQFCQPGITGVLLTPNRSISLENADGLTTQYRRWFGDCTQFQVEASRVAPVGERLGIFYRFRVEEQEDWFSIEQQIFCTLKDGRVERLQLLCSGFQPVRTNIQSAAAGAPEAGEQLATRDGLLEFYSQAPEAGSTCALLTPAIRSKLREMQSGQVLEVRVDDPSAQGDIEAWSRLSGNTLLKTIVDEEQRLRFFLRKK